MTSITDRWLDQSLPGALPAPTICSLARPIASDPAVRPAHHAPVAIRHDAVKRPRLGVEHEWQEVTVAFPERQLVDPVEFNPFERALGIALVRLACQARDDEHEAEPVLAVLAESRPADRAAQVQLEALDAGFLVNLAAHPSDDVLVGFELAAEAVVLAEVLVARACVAMDHQHAATIGRQHVAERGENRGVGHFPTACSGNAGAIVRSFAPGRGLSGSDGHPLELSRR